MTAAASGGGVNGLSLQQQITDLGVKMEKGFDRMEALLRAFDERVRQVENREAACQPFINARLEGMTTDLTELRKAVDDLQLKNAAKDRELERLNSHMRLVSWLGGGGGGVVMAWLIGRILGLL